MLARVLHLTLITLAGGVAIPVAALDTQLVSQAAGAPVPWRVPNAQGSSPLLSADGQVAVFTSRATNLIPGAHPNDISKPYVWDAQLGELRAVGVEPNSAIVLQSISADGTWVGVSSYATNLVPGRASFGRPPLSSPYPAQIYALNTRTGEYRYLYSRGNSITFSADGKRVAIASISRQWNVDHVIIIDLATGAASNITPSANKASRPLGFSRDGRLLVFWSRANNLQDPSTLDSQSFTYIYDLDADNIEVLPNELRYYRFADNGTKMLVNTSRSDLVTGVDAPVEEGIRTLLFDRATNEYSYLLPTTIFNNLNVEISGDSQRLVFSTQQALVPEDSNSGWDVYLFDRPSEELRLVSAPEIERSYAPTSQISFDGSQIVSEGYIYDVALEQRMRVDLPNGNPVAWSANGASAVPSISDDGNVVSFVSLASNLLAQDDQDELIDVFIYERNSGQVEKEPGLIQSRSFQSGVQSLGGDGRYLTYVADQQLRIVDRNSQTTRVIPDVQSGLSVSQNGQRLTAYVTPASGERGIYLFDLEQNSATLVVRNHRASQISGDGNVVLFASRSQTLVDNYPEPGRFRSEYFVWERETNEIELLISGGLDAIREPALSYDGRFVVFTSDECYVYDRAAQAVTAVFPERHAHCEGSSVSQDNRFMVFGAPEDDLVPEGNVAGQSQLYVHDRSTGEIALLTPHGEHEPVGAVSRAPVISADGTTIAYESTLESLTPDGNYLRDVFVVDNPLFNPADTGALFSLTATRRAGTRIVDVQAQWPPDARWTQVQEVAVPGGLLWDGPDRSWSGEYLVPDDVDLVVFNSRYWIANAEFGNTTVEVSLIDNPVEPPGPVDPPDPAGLTLGGFVWVDANGDGRRDDDEAGEADRNILLYRCEAPWGIAGRAVSSAPLGNWTIVGLEPGSYQIGTPPDGLRFSPVVNDNSVYENGFSNCFNVDDNHQQIGMGLLSAGSPRLSLTGFAWLDTNADGVRDDGELPDIGREVTAFRCEAPWGAVGKASTDDSGRFEISGVPQGSYQYGVVAAGSEFSPLGADNQIFPNGFSSCVETGEGVPAVGIGVIAP